MIRTQNIIFKKRRYSAVTYIALITGISHGYALLVFGATFWFDGMNYVNLGEILRTPPLMRAFYDGVGMWFFTHFQPGLPVVWVATTFFPEGLRWPVLAIFQHILAASALVFCFVTVHKYWPSRIHIISCAVLSCLPFYQSLHNALLSESITSSLLIIAFALCLRLVKEKSIERMEFWGVMACLFLITQFRSYYGLIILTFAVLVMVRHRLIFSKYLCLCGVVFTVAILLYPLFRYHTTGMLFFPTGGMNSLLAGWRVNPSPSVDVRTLYNEYQFPPNLSFDNLIGKGLDYDKTIALGYFWRAEGLTDSQINKKAEELGSLLRNDGVKVLINRLFLGTASIGSVLPYSLIKHDLMVFPGLTAAGMYKHQLNNYRYLSWIDKESHSGFLERFFVAGSSFDGLPLLKESKRLLYNTIYPYQANASQNDYQLRSKVFLRNPLLIGWLPPDIWILSCFLALAYLAYREKYIVAMASSAILINFLIAFGFPLGNVRYAYPLFPIYFAVVSIAFAVHFQKEK